ncbi:MAG: hypothetical protein LBM96_10750 [Methanobrevibacter sp.]|jgi:hypothetical protein|nr:hypothetical protein [Candidatus Methanoflexus mossambicus]
MAGKYTEKMSAKVHPSVKEWFQQSDYNARNALEYFVREVSKDSRKFDLLNLEQEILDLKSILIGKEKMAEDLRKSLGIKKGDSGLDVKVNRAIVNFLAKYDEKKDYYVNLEDFIKSNDLLLVQLANHAKLGCEEFIKLLFEHSEEVRL